MKNDGSIEIIARNVRIRIYTIYDQKFADENTFYPLSKIFKMQIYQRGGD